MAPGSGRTWRTGVAAVALASATWLVRAWNEAPPPTLPPEEKWLGEFTPHPRARLVCRQHVVGAGPDAPHIEWALYATADPPERVVAFYAAARGVKARAGQSTLTVSDREGRRKLSIQPVSASYPDCGAKPDSDAKTVLVASHLIAPP